MLGKQYKVTETKDRTRDKILLVSARLFAVEGYYKISMRDIANAVGIKASSIYNHYPGKQAILEDVLDRTEDLIETYFSRLLNANEEIQSLETSLDSLFVEVRSIPTLFIHYGLVICLQGQFRNERCRNIYYHAFFEEGKKVLQTIFDRVIEQEKAVPFDTEMLAEVVMDCFSIASYISVCKKEGLLRNQLYIKNVNKLSAYFKKIASAGV